METKSLGGAGRAGLSKVTVKGERKGMGESCGAVLYIDWEEGKVRSLVSQQFGRNVGGLKEAPGKCQPRRLCGRCSYVCSRCRDVQNKLQARPRFGNGKVCVSVLFLGPDGQMGGCQAMVGMVELSCCAGLCGMLLGGLWKGPRGSLHVIALTSKQGEDLQLFAPQLQAPCRFC